MDTDLALTLGMLLIALAVPAIMSAIADGRSPRVPAVVLLIGGGLILYALGEKPGGYRLHEIPDAFFGVLGRYLP